MSGPRRAPVRVLVVDDSAVVRELVTQVLQHERSLSVAVAADPLIAMRKMQSWRPDVILLDLEMPRMDGRAFLRKLMAEDPIPVVIFSSTTGAVDAAVSALAEGAVDIVTKPQIGIRDFLADSRAMLVDTVLGAASAKVARRASPRAIVTEDDRSPTRRSLRDRASADVIAIGASTGGTEALLTILEALPVETPGVAVVQHMPEGFTGAFAQRLDASCRVEVKEAAQGDVLARGRVLLAPGNRHLVVRRRGGEYVVDLSDAPRVSRHRPSVDVLFRSVASAVGASAIGVILTGMGSDGADGLLEMKRCGAATIAQDEATCVVFGMPKEAIARGAVDDVVPLERVPSLILERVADRSRDLA